MVSHGNTFSSGCKNAKFPKPSLGLLSVKCAKARQALHIWVSQRQTIWKDVVTSGTIFSSRFFHVHSIPAKRYVPVQWPPVLEAFYHAKAGVQKDFTIKLCLGEIMGGKAHKMIIQYK